MIQLRNVAVRRDYLVVEDSNINGHSVLPDWGPRSFEALQEYFSRYPDDHDRDIVREEKFGFTFAPQVFYSAADNLASTTSSAKDFPDDPCRTPRSPFRMECCWG